MTEMIRASEPGKFVTVGFLKPNTTATWTRIQDTSKHNTLALAVQHVASNVLGYPLTFAARIGRGTLRFPPCSESEYTVLIYWTRSFDTAQLCEADTNGSITIKHIVGPSYDNTNLLQLLFTRTKQDDQPTLDDILAPHAEDDTHSNSAAPTDNPS